MMPPKQGKKTIWEDCENCKCTILSANKNLHEELKCDKNASKCPFVCEEVLHGRLERTARPQTLTRGTVLMNPSTAKLISAAIGQPLLLRRCKGSGLVRRAWPERSAAPDALLIPAADLAGDWLDGDDQVTISVLKESVPEASNITIHISSHKLDSDLCDILKEHFIQQYVCIGSTLVYYYFGKRLEIEVIDIRKEDGAENTWFLLSSNTSWNFNKDSKKITRKVNNLGGIADIVEEIKIFVAISFSTIETKFQPTRGLLIYGHSGIGKTAMCKYLLTTINCHHIEINGPTVFSKYFGETESILKEFFNKAIQNQPSIIFVDEIETVCPRKTSGSTEQERRVTSAFVSLVDRLHEDDARVFIIATTRKPDSIDPMLRRFGRLDKEIEIPVPDRIRRRDILSNLLKSIPAKVSESDIENISDLAHGYVAADLVNLCTQASMKCLKRTSEFVQNEDLVSALTVVRPSAMRELLVEIPNVRWGDIGGQADLKLKLRQAVEWPLKHAESFKRLGVKPPGGVLLYGPPGCSKTMIAKALATESGLNFMSIKGPELFSKWVGESERAVRDLFSKARQVAPSVIFFDEMDAVGGERGAGEGVHERVLAQLLTELDGVVPLSSVTVLAATNRPDRMDRALLRPGRLDRLIYVPLPDSETRLQILELKLAVMSTTEAVDPHSLAARTDGFSGAELHALCQEAALRALETDLDCPAVDMKHFELVLDGFKPRTPASLLKIYEEFALGQRSC